MLVSFEAKRPIGPKSTAERTASSCLPVLSTPQRTTDANKQTAFVTTKRQNAWILQDIVVEGTPSHLCFSPNELCWFVGAPAHAARSPATAVESNGDVFCQWQNGQLMYNLARPTTACTSHILCGPTCAMHQGKGVVHLGLREDVSDTTEMRSRTGCHREHSWPTKSGHSGNEAHLSGHTKMSRAETTYNKLLDRRQRSTRQPKQNSILVPELNALGEATTGHIVGEGPLQPGHQQVLPIRRRGNSSVQPGGTQLLHLPC